MNDLSASRASKLSHSGDLQHHIDKISAYTDEKEHSSDSANEEDNGGPQLANGKLKNQRSKKKIVEKTQTDEIINAPTQVVTKRPDSKRKATT